MTSKEKPYKVLAEIIYAEHPDLKEQLNIGAALVIETLKGSLETDLSAKDLEAILSIIAAIIADLMSTSANSLSEKLNLIFDIHSLAAAAVIDEIDLGDTTPAKDMMTVVREAKERTQAREAAGANDDETGMFL